MANALKRSYFNLGYERPSSQVRGPVNAATGQKLNKELGERD